MQIWYSVMVKKVLQVWLLIFKLMETKMLPGINGAKNIKHIKMICIIMSCDVK